MIIEMLLGVIYKLLNLFLVFEIPSLPDTVMTYVDTIFDYMVMGASILANYTPLSYLLSIMGLIILVDGGIMIYHFVMWILRKIPVASIS